MYVKIKILSSHKLGQILVMTIRYIFMTYYVEILLEEVGPLRSYDGVHNVCFEVHFVHNVHFEVHFVHNVCFGLHFGCDLVLK